MFTEADKKQIAAKGLTAEKISAQLDRFQKGFESLEITAAASIGNGVVQLDKDEQAKYVASYEQSEVDVLKFVPASGAATRMFKLLFNFVEKFQGTQESLDVLREEPQIAEFFDRLSDFAFYDELSSKYQKAAGHSVATAIENFKHGEVVNFLLQPEGLGYGTLPKGLLTFHKYDDTIRTAAQEQLHEGIAYASKTGKVRVHFTVSPNHQKNFDSHVNEAIKELASKDDIEVSFSTQKENTDTVASTTDFEAFRDANGALFFRPAGHGALLENLNDLNSDIIFIKNIDNVLPDRLKEDTIQFKKALAGVLLEFQEQSFTLLRRSESGEDVAEEATELLKQMGISGNLTSKQSIEFLNRPIRVCGMVRNEGEPGGGPFWVKATSYDSLQIVESAQVDGTNQAQQELFKKGTHFNPVDLVCGTKDYKGQKFDLLKHRDMETGFISEKSHNGEKLLAMELPGLWNGSMAYWNTIFVEVPITTFSPVKTVNDLLKPSHQ